jgi:hypothetical protein
VRLLAFDDPWIECNVKIMKNLDDIYSVIDLSISIIYHYIKDLFDSFGSSSDMNAEDYLTWM